MGEGVPQTPTHQRPLSVLYMDARFSSYTTVIEVYNVCIAESQCTDSTQDTDRAVCRVCIILTTHCLSSGYNNAVFKVGVCLLLGVEYEIKEMYRYRTPTHREKFYTNV